MKKRALAVLAAALLLPVTGFALTAAMSTRRPGSNPLTRAALSAAEEFTVEADVVEQLPAGRYLYLRVVENRREHWVATLASTAPKGARRVRLQVIGRAHDFHSARLDRDFAELWFAAVQPAVTEGAVP